MVDRGRSPGAKGTAFPFSKRPARHRGKPYPGKPGGADRPGGNSGILSWQAPATTSAANPPAAAKPPEDVSPPREVVPPQAASGLPNGVRLSKLMAERGLCSRREADEYIENGWVFVDGQRISQLGTRVDPSVEITLAQEARRRQGKRVTILLNKPVGYVSGQAEDGHQPASALFEASRRWEKSPGPEFHPAQLRGLAPAGRLDIDSTGLLVLTQDGRIARRLVGDDSDVEKEYLVRVQGSLSPEDLARLNHGLSLDGQALRPAEVSWLNEDQLRFVLREGRKRQIRRMCELVGLKVTGLKRVRIGKVRLGALPEGQWRFLGEDEVF